MNEQPQPPPPTTGDKVALLAMIVVGNVLLLISVTIVVGLVQGDLNPTAVATMLGGILTTTLALLFTALIKGKDKVQK